MEDDVNYREEELTGKADNELDNENSSRIEEIISRVKRGGFVIVRDEDKRENEADLMTSAEDITKEDVAFMIRHGSGLICAPLSEEKKQRLCLKEMSSSNTSVFATPMLEGVDARRCLSTGISAEDRAITIRELARDNSSPEDFLRPGHVIPLRASSYGIMERRGHTEAAIELMKLAGKKEVAAIVELCNEKGEMLRGEELEEFSKENDIPIIAINEIIRERVRRTNFMELISEAYLPTEEGDFNALVFRNRVNKEEMFVVVKGNIKGKEGVIVRVHSQCLTGDTFHSLRCDCRHQLKDSLRIINKEGGAVIYLPQEGRGIGLANKIKAYKLQDNGMDTAEANLSLGFRIDEREYWEAAQIIKNLGIKSVRLITNNTKKINALRDAGIDVTSRIVIKSRVTRENKQYLRTKREKMGHLLEEDIKNYKK